MLIRRGVNSVKIRFALRFMLILALASSSAQSHPGSGKPNHTVLTGQEAYADYTQQKPGVFRKITLADLPQPFATESAVNDADVVPRPEGAMPETLPGFKVELYFSSSDRPRLIRTAPN